MNSMRTPVTTCLLYTRLNTRKVCRPYVFALVADNGRTKKIGSKNLRNLQREHYDGAAPETVPYRITTTKLLACRTRKTVASRPKMK